MREISNGYACSVGMTSSSRYLFFAIPFSEGWTAWVEGKPTELLHVNISFMALDLGEGHHDVELKYSTPGLLWSIMLLVLVFLELLI
ncbi:MAG: YfhO family protein [Eggerthellaceae bacterium]|nr:YfhO family protein [Eggerthellaceae bacterium]